MSDTPLTRAQIEAALEYFGSGHFSRCDRAHVETLLRAAARHADTLPRDRWEVTVRWPDSDIYKYYFTSEANARRHAAQLIEAGAEEACVLKETR